ncbi:hypothetical protein [Candidatus Haliotispira prima]
MSLSKSLQRMAGFQNIVMHEYQSFQLPIVNKNY